MRSKRSSFYPEIVLRHTLHHRMCGMNFKTIIPILPGSVSVLILILLQLPSLPANPATTETSQASPDSQQLITLRESVLLSTKTPLGDAVVRLATGTPVSIVETKGDWVLVKKPPFSAWVRNSQTSLAPSTSEAPSALPTPSPEVTTNPATVSIPRPAKDARDVGFRLPEWVPSLLIIPGFPWHIALLAYGGLSSILILILLVLLLRQRRTGQATMKAAQPFVSLEVKTPPLPGFVECPLCNSPILIESLSIGENQCPNCSGRFDCE